MNAIGVGDMKAITSSGKLISFVCGVSGILFIGLPIPIVVESFTAYYNGQQRRLKVVKRCKSIKNNDAQQDCSQSILTQVFKGHSDYVAKVCKLMYSQILNLTVNLEQIIIMADFMNSKTIVSTRSRLYEEMGTC